MNKIPEKAIQVASAGVYPYSERLLEKGNRVTSFGDEYNLFRVVGQGENRRVWVPRNLAADGSPTNYAEGLDCRFKSSFVPRNGEQARLVSESVQLLAQGQSFILEAPTGIGKTVCAMDIIAQTGKKTIVIVTKEDIRDQWVAAARSFLGLTNDDIGFIQADKFQVAGKKLVIAMIQSLAKEDRYPVSEMKEFGLMIADEVHRLGADHFSQACFRVPARLRLGLSATPKRKDGRTALVSAHIGPVMVRSVVAAMTPKIIVRKSPWQIPMTRIEDPMGGYKVGPIPHKAGKCGHIINIMMNNHERNQMLVDFIVAAHKKGRFILVQSDRKAHLENLMALSGSGIPQPDMGFYIGGMSAKAREEAKTKRVIFATFAMTAEATDIPHLDTLVMATPKSDVRQIVGRILRVHEGKRHPVVFDIVDNSSSVFSGYWKKRYQWYRSINAEIDGARA